MSSNQSSDNWAKRQTWYSDKSGVTQREGVQCFVLLPPVHDPLLVAKCCVSRHLKQRVRQRHLLFKSSRKLDQSIAPLLRRRYPLIRYNQCCPRRRWTLQSSQMDCRNVNDPYQRYCDHTGHVAMSCRSKTV